MAIDLSIVTVVTNAATVEAASRLLASVADSDFSGDLEMIVVSNGFSGKQLDDLRTRYGWASFLVADRNLGYAGGNNWGMLKSKGRLVLLLNPDVRVHRDALSRLVEFIDSNPEASGATGKLLGDDGKVQVGFNVRRLPTLPSSFAEALLLHRALWWTGFVKRHWGTGMDYDAAQQVEQPAGACLLARRELIEQVGVMDESFYPIWYEDVDWCMRIRSYGRQLWYVPDAVFDHTGAVSTIDWSKSDALLVKYRNFAYFSKKHFGVPLSFLLILTIAVGMLLRSFLVLIGRVFGFDLSESVKYFRKGDTLAAVKGYMRVFWLCITARL